jgi:hypothetical protein
MDGPETSRLRADPSSRRLERVDDIGSAAGAVLGRGVADGSSVW